MKKALLFLLALSSYSIHAEIAIYNLASKNDFYGIGGFSYTQSFFTAQGSFNPFLVEGPSPQNNFGFSVSATGGLKNDTGYILTNNTNTGITINFAKNNIKKFGCDIFGLIGFSPTQDMISVTATSNLGENYTITTNERFVGFQAFDANEYITLITATFQAPPNPAARIALYLIMIGDNTPQNVALNFDGENDYVSIPSNVGNFTTNQDFTVSCWIKPDLIQTTQSGQTPYENDIISKWAGLGAMANNNYPFVIRYLNQIHPDISQRGKILVGQWDGTIFQTIISTITVDDGKWHHVAFVREGGVGADIFKLYIDGVLEGTNTTNVPGTTNNTTPLQFGRRGNNQSYFKGEIDEVRIWNIGKNATQIVNEMFCKNPELMGLQASYSFSNGVPHDNNSFITQVQDVLGTNHGILNNFAKTGNASNFVTGQVKYVKKPSFGNLSGSSWANSIIDLQNVLTPNTGCNDLFDVYVGKGTTAYTPHTSNVNTAFNIPEGMRLYGGFAGTEKSINQRNMALIHSTYETTLSGDLDGNDTPFNFTTNRIDNSQTVVLVNGSNAILDGFTIRGAATSSGVNINPTISNTLINHNKIIDNQNGISLQGNNTYISNSIISGNEFIGIKSRSDNSAIEATQLDINDCIIANNGYDGFTQLALNSNMILNITNCTIASNNGVGLFNNFQNGTIINNIKNTIIKDNSLGGIGFEEVPINNFFNNILNSLIQDETSTANGNLNGSVNPLFVSPVANTTINDLGDYHLKDSSPCINVGTDIGVSPLDLDRNPRTKGGKTDMGAYESNVNMNEIISITTGNWENKSTWNLDRVPLATDKVIMNGHTVTVTTPNAKGKIIEQKPSSDLKFNTGGSLQLNQ